MRQRQRLPLLFIGVSISAAALTASATPRSVEPTFEPTPVGPQLVEGSWKADHQRAAELARCALPGAGGHVKPTVIDYHFEAGDGQTNHGHAHVGGAQRFSPEAKECMEAVLFTGWHMLTGATFDGSIVIGANAHDDRPARAFPTRDLVNRTPILLPEVPQTAESKATLAVLRAVERCADVPGRTVVRAHMLVTPDGNLFDATIVNGAGADIADCIREGIELGARAETVTELVVDFGVAERKAYVVLR